MTYVCGFVIRISNLWNYKSNHAYFLWGLRLAIHFEHIYDTTTDSNIGEREPWYPKNIPERIVTNCLHSTKVCRRTVSTSYSTDQIGTCLIRVATAHSNYCCRFKFQNWSWNTKRIRRSTRWFFYFKQSHTSCQFWWLLNSGMVIVFWTPSPIHYKHMMSHRQLSCTFENMSYITGKYVNLPQW